jgi:CRISPR-associated protein Cmr3
MNTLLLHPTDTLFFRDGRPMSGSLSGHGAAWPLPSVLNAALHAALHRAALADVHEHKRGRSSDRASNAERDRKFGSLTTAGPFPVDAMDQWYFPCPADAQKSNSTKVTFYPAAIPGPSSLPKPLSLSVANSEPPTKDKPAPWWSQEAWCAYLNGTPSSNEDHFKTDAHFTDTEHSIGIGISAETGTQNGEQLYSAHSLRLREGWRLGALAEALDKKNGEPSDKRDLIELLFPNSGQRTPVIVGGQQRLCTVERHQTLPLPLPFAPVITGTRVKWVLLTPAIFPAINDHPGGWLPSWVDLQGKVQLLDGPGKNYAKRHRIPEGQRIPARLVAALVGKPLPVTGYALPNSADPDRTEGGAKSTHLAVPAGAVYYFEAESDTAAQALATALNWHGNGTAPTTIKNRRSTLMGEKGFGLGLCGTWTFLNS